MSVNHNLPALPTDDQSIWRRSRRNVSITATGSALSFAIKFAQTALLTRILNIEDYGRVLIVINFFVFLDSFFGLRVSDLVFRFFPEFREQRDERSLKGLLLLTLGLCAGTGLLIFGAVFFFSPWLADRFYPNLGLSPLFRSYALAALFSSFSGFYEPILRLQNRFGSVVAPQVLGGLITIGLLLIYLTNQPTYDLKIVVVAFTLGAVVQTVLPLTQALRVIRRFCSGPGVKESLQALKQRRRALSRTLLNSNLSGYLKLAIYPGDIFLLGLFSTPTQIAWYGLAKQLTMPLALLQTNLQTAVMPEIAHLASQGKFEQLKRLLRRYLTRIAKAGGIVLLVVVVVGHILIAYFLSSDYAPALPLLYLLAIAAWLLLVFLVFRPLALSLDLLKWHNLALLTSSILVLLVTVLGRLSALTMATIQLADALVIRSIFSSVVWRQLKRRNEQ